MMNLNKSLRIAFRLSLLIPLFVWGWDVYSGNIGADPAKAFNHHSGEISLYFLLANLSLGVLISFKLKWTNFLSFLFQERRWLGVTTFGFLILHFLFYLLLEGFETKAWVQIYTKTYLIFGGLAWLGMMVLALTSNNFSVRKLGFKRWKLIHRFVYVFSALVTVHVLLIEKTDLVKYGILLALLWILQLGRWTHLYFSRKRA